jgi:hypothetical protein
LLPSLLVAIAVLLGAGLAAIMQTRAVPQATVTASCNMTYQGLGSASTAT